MHYACRREAFGQSNIFDVFSPPIPITNVVCAGYSSLAGQAVTQSPVSSVLHPAMSAAAVAAAAGKLPALPSSVSQMSPVSAAAAGAAAGPSQLVPHREKKYRPPHKTDKFTPKPIPPELGNLKTYSESTFV